MNSYPNIPIIYVYEWLFVNKFIYKNLLKLQLNSLINKNAIVKTSALDKLLNQIIISSYCKVYKINMINFNDNFILFYFFRFFLSKFFYFRVFYDNLLLFVLELNKTIFDEGFFYIRGLIIIFFVDACITDDEPLWEPIEWSLVQTWLMFIFIFAWIAENLITSRFGSYTGRDKRIWFAWYKAFWFLNGWYAISYGVAVLFVITPFYFEITYNMAFVASWWNWYTQIFFFKFISLYTIIILLSYLFQLNIRWLNWKKLFLFILLINIFIAYLLYTHFIMTFFCYFTDPLWYQKTRFVDYIQLSHEPVKWGWGTAKRDHFTYHKVSTVFWFKNDNPFAGAFLMINMFLFLSILFLYIYWLVLLRRVYTTKEISFTFATYCVSSLKQFFYFFLMLYIFVFFSFIINYWRFPIEFVWLINPNSWIIHFLSISYDYLRFILGIFF
jgi:hypothetical protein